MKTHPIAPARIDWSGPVPHAVDYGDLYHPRVGAFEQARHVFLAGNGLPGRWRGRERFVILETGFGLGHNFLATWQAWRDDAARPRRLHFVSIEKHPPRADDLRRAHAHAPCPELAAALQRAWPPLTPNLHALDLDDGRVELLLAFGDVQDILPALRLDADAFFLDGFAPACNPAMWSRPVLTALGRRAAEGATAATWSVAREVREGLVAAGFEVRQAEGLGGKRTISVAHFAPRHAVGRLPSMGVAARHALVVGAGIAGAAAAHALRAQGLEVTVFDRHPAPAGEASGNPGALVHGLISADDGPHARLLRSAAVHAPRRYRPWLESRAVAGRLEGMLWLDARAGDLAAMRSALAAGGWPDAYVSALDAPEASRAAGIALDRPAWFFPEGGWVAPGDVVRCALEGTRFVGGVEVAAVDAVDAVDSVDAPGRRDGATPDAAGPDGSGQPGEAVEPVTWALRTPDGRVLDTAPLVVLACAASAPALLGGLGDPAWPLAQGRGQISMHRGADPTPLQRPLAGDGYALPLGDGALLCGSTRVPGDLGTDLRDAEHRFNAQRARRLTGLDLPLDPAAWQGRAGLRLQARDRLPIAGAVAAPPHGVAAARTETPGVSQPASLRTIARAPGLFVLSALGSRGITLAPLLGRLIAAQACGAPWPLEQDLAEAVDPARWIVRAARRRGEG